MLSASLKSVTQRTWRLGPNLSESLKPLHMNLGDLTWQTRLGDPKERDFFAKSFATSHSIVARVALDITNLMKWFWNCSCAVIPRRGLGIYNTKFKATTWKGRSDTTLTGEWPSSDTYCCWYCNLHMFVYISSGRHRAWSSNSRTSLDVTSLRSLGVRLPQSHGFLAESHRLN